MFPNWQLVSISIGYIGILFLIAYMGDKYRHKLKNSQHTIIYALSLGVYCTSWGFLGTAGQAANYSFTYLPVYIAPILLFIFAWPFIQRIIRVCLKLNITSIADLLAARFGKSQSLAIIVTLVALIGTIPYIALQLKAIVHSYVILQQNQDLSVWQLGLIVSFILAGFTIIFGIRTIDVTERHPGVMIAIAFESLVKLIAFLAIGLFVSFIVFKSPSEIWQLSKASINMEHQFSSNNLLSMFGLLIIVMSAFLCLPRQFQVMIVELKDQQHTKMSRWLFPLYVLVFAFFAAPLGLAGSILYGESLQPDAYVLFLPAYNGQLWLTLFSFLGAISAASSMVIISTIALSTMLSNEIVFPLLFRKTNIQDSNFKFFQSQLLFIRKMLVLLVILLSYGMFMAAPPDTLASLGEVAFGAIAQIGPPLFAAFYWRKVSLTAVLLAITSGFGIWITLNLLPQLGFYPHPLADLAYAPTTVATLIGLTINTAVLALFSKLVRPGIQEQMQLEHFFERPQNPISTTSAQRKIDAKQLELLTSRFIGMSKAQASFREFYQTQKLLNLGKKAYNEALIFHTENTLASVMGSASARLVISFALDGRDIALDEVAQLVEDASSQRMEFSRNVLHSAIENTSEGISVIDDNLKLVAWNKIYLDMFDYPESLIYIGSPVKDLIGHNLARRPECSVNIDEQVEKRLQFLRAGSRHSTERVQPDGRIIRIEGNPIPGGGFVMIFSDITMYREAENLLKERNLDLEGLVNERTTSLAQANEQLEKTNRDLATARFKAEQAHIKKSQYLRACSHDLLQPLSAARLFSSTLALSNRLNHEDIQQLKNIDNSLKTANDLLRDLNEVALIESGNLKVNLQNTSLESVLKSLYSEFLPLAKQYQVELEYKVESCIINTDAKMLRRILQNILSNAFKYASPGKISLISEVTNETVCITIKDNGPGIPKDKQLEVFEQFSQLDNPAATGNKGLGLGLNIAQSLSCLLGTHIKLNSVDGHGCSFSVEFSLADEHIIDPQIVPVADVKISDITVLCIDNEPDVLNGMVSLLSAWKCNVLAANSYAEAIDIFNDFGDKIDIVLADYHLDKNNNGLDLLLNLQKIKGYALPGIVITANVDSGIKAAVTTHGFGYLKKIIKPLALRAMMSSLLTQALQKAYNHSPENDEFPI